MKRKLLTILVLFVIQNVFWGEVKFEGLSWFDYDISLDTNGNVSKGGQFDVSRLYMTLQGDSGKDWFGNSIKARITLDLAKAEFNETSIKTTKFVTNVSVSYSNGNVTNVVVRTADGIIDVSKEKSFPIKYAYFDYIFKFISERTNDEGEVIKDTIANVILSAGQMQSYFGFISFWKYPIPVKDPVEAFSSVKPTASADFGVMLSGNILPKNIMKDGFFRYYIQLLNGEGYEKLFSASSSANNNFAYNATFVGQPLPGLSIGGSFRQNYLPAKTDTSYAIFLSGKDVRFGFEDSSFVLPIDFLAEYVALSSLATNANATPVNGYVASVMVGYNFAGLFGFDASKTQISPYVRYDLCVPNTSTNVVNQVLYVALNISPTANLSIKPLFQYNLDNSTIAYKVQAEYKLGFSIWQ